jgi:hypothetical protein
MASMRHAKILMLDAICREEASCCGNIQGMDCLLPSSALYVLYFILISSMQPATAPVTETQGASKRARRSADAEAAPAGDEFAFRQSGGQTDENTDEKKSKAEAKRPARGKAAATTTVPAETTPEAAPAPAQKGRGAKGKKTSNSSSPDAEPEVPVASTHSTQLEICAVIDSKVKVQTLLEHWNEATLRSIVSLNETAQNHPLSLSILAFSVDATAFFIAAGVSINQAFTVDRTVGSSLSEDVLKKPVNACQLHAAAMAAHIGSGSRSLKVKALKTMAAMLDPSDEENARMVARTYLEENVASKRGFPVEQLSAALAFTTSAAQETTITSTAAAVVVVSERVEAEHREVITAPSAMEIEPAEAPVAESTSPSIEASEPIAAAMELEAVLDACEANLEKDDELTSLPDIDMDMPSLTSNIPAVAVESVAPEVVSVEEIAPEAATVTSPAETEILSVSTPLQAVTPSITPVASKIVAKAEADDQAEKEKALLVEQAKARVDAFRSKFNVSNTTPASDGTSPSTSVTSTTPPTAVVSPEAAVVPQPAPAAAPAAKSGAIRVPSAMPSLKPAVPTQGNRPSADPAKGTALQKTVDRMKAREQISLAVNNKKTLIENGKTGPVPSIRPIGPALIKPAPTAAETKPVDAAVKPAEAAPKPSNPPKPHVGANAIPLLGLVPRNGGMIAVAAGLTDKPSQLQQLLSPMPVRSVPGLGNHHTAPLTLQSLHPESLLNTAAAASLAVADALRDAGVSSVVTKIELPPKVQPAKAAPVAVPVPAVAAPVAAPAPTPVPAPVSAPVPAPAPAPAPTTVASNTSAPIASLVSPTSLLFKQNTVVLKAADQDNYEMSDKEDTDEEEEEDDEDDDRPKKKVPDWAHGSALAEAIHKQYGDDAVDPDVIFPEIQSCDLEDIFKIKKKRFAKRTSSGNWNYDRLRDGEKRQYRKDMGFDSS